MASIRELVVSLGLDFDSSGFAKAEAAIGVLKTGFAGVGAVLGGLAAGLTAITVSVAKQADAVGDLGATLGVSTDALQRLGYAAQLSGASAEAMNAGLMFLSRNAATAADGGKEAAEQFAKFGVQLKDQHGQLKTSDRLFLDVANGIGRIKSPTAQAAAAAQLLGRSAGPQLVQLLRQGEDGINALGDELVMLGGLMDGDFIAASAEFNDTLDRMQSAIRGVGITIAKAFLPFLSGAVKGIVEWYKANREVISSRVTFFVERMASAFNGLGNIIGLVVSAVSKVVGSFARANPMIAGTIAIVAALALAFASPAFAIMFLSALLLAIADDINVFVTGGKSVLGDFVDFMRKWGKDQGGIIGELIETFFGLIQWFKGAGWDAVFAEMSTAFDTSVNWIMGKIDAMLAAFAKVKGFISSMFGDQTITSTPNTAAEWQAARAGVQGVAEFGSGLSAAGITGGLGGAIGSNPAQNISSSAVANSNVVNGGASSSNVTATVNVQAAPGQDEAKIGSAVADRILEEKRKAELRDAHSAFMPAKAAQ
jgi:hypothetical protein